jgi:hypothetical protein
MSTKTNFKRIALVAVAALGLGVLSSVPSQAAVSNLTLTVTNGNAVNGKSDSSNAALITVKGLADVGVGDSITVTFINKDVSANTSAVARMSFLESTTPSVGTLVSTSRGANAPATKWANTNGVADTKLAGAAPYVVFSPTAAYIGATFAVQLESVTAGLNTAGTFTYTALASSYAGATLIASTQADFTITIAETAAESTTPSATYTNAYMGATSSISADAVISPKVATASTTAAAFVRVFLRNAANADDVAKDTITVTLSGAGLLGDGASPTAYSKSLTGYKTGTATYAVVPDGTAGSATITITTSRTGQSWTKSLSFYSATPASITAAAFHPVLNVGANTGAVAVSAKDSAGNNWTGSTWIYASSATDALTAGSSTPVACAAWNSIEGILCPVTGTLNGTAKLKVINASTVGAATVTSNEITVTVSTSIVSSVKLAFNKASYAPGEKALLTVTPLGADGKALGARTFTNLLDTGGITSSLTFGSGSDTTTAVAMNTSAFSSASSNLVAGAKTYVVYMPAAGGTMTVTATGGTDLPVAGQVAVSASATVTDSGAAALAAVNALATTVASLRTLITTLTNLVLKIQKKVKA